MAGRLMKRILLVVDKESLAVRHLAEGSRLSSSLRDVAPSQYDDVLRG